jgi:endonuclease/exonuclease/phosphatase family metal-dependent hydrolase
MVNKLLILGFFIMGSAISAESSAIEDDLTILSWNIKMFSAPYGWLHNRIERAENIIQSLKNSTNYDVILFQEAFSSKIRKQIYRGLKLLYPYQIEPEDHFNFFKTNSGLWAISKMPIELIDQISFSKLKEWDWMSSKGAKLYSVIKNDKEILLINTHLQSDYKTNYSSIRRSQYDEINLGLILPYVKINKPLILCGDLNISNVVSLDKMLKHLNLKNGPLSGKLQFSTFSQPNELVDYILVKTDKFRFKSIQRRIQDFSMDFLEYSTNMSDHYPIEANFIWEHISK